MNSLLAGIDAKHQARIYAAFKVVYLAMLQASKKWAMQLWDWKAALNRFSIELGDRVPPLNYCSQ